MVFLCHDVNDIFLEMAKMGRWVFSPASVSCPCSPSVCSPVRRRSPALQPLRQLLGISHKSVQVKAACEARTSQPSRPSRAPSQGDMKSDDLFYFTDLLLCRYVGLELVPNILFVFFLLSWVFSRLYVYPNWVIRSTLYDTLVRRFHAP